MKGEQKKRIVEMENYLNEISEVLTHLNRSLDKYVATIPKLEKLSEYYTSSNWMQDFEDSNKSDFPSPVQLSHGILSEDAIFSLLSNHKDIVIRMLKISTNALEIMH